MTVKDSHTTSRLHIPHNHHSPHEHRRLHVIDNSKIDQKMINCLICCLRRLHVIHLVPSINPTNPTCIKEEEKEVKVTIM